MRTDRHPVNRSGVRHGGRNMGHFLLSTAYHKAAHKTLLTGVRHRVEICRIPVEDHYLPAAWGGLHFVTRPVEDPRPTTEAGS